MPKKKKPQKNYGKLSLIFAIVGFLLPIIGIFFIVPALVFGHRALRILDEKNKKKTKKSKDKDKKKKTKAIKQEKDKLAMAGLILGYLWILLAILIGIGFAAVTYIDFSFLYSDGLELDNNFKAIGAYSVAKSTGPYENYVVIAFIPSQDYSISINPGWGETSITSFDGSKCSLNAVKNSDSTELSISGEGPTRSDLETGAKVLGPNQEVAFEPGQIGVLEFDCSQYNNFIPGQVLVGNIQVLFRDSRDNLVDLSSGEVRLTIRN